MFFSSLIIPRDNNNNLMPLLTVLNFASYWSTLVKLSSWFSPISNHFLSDIQFFYKEAALEIMSLEDPTLWSIFQYETYLTFTNLQEVCLYLSHNIGIHRSTAKISFEICIFLQIIFKSTILYGTQIERIQILILQFVIWWANYSLENFSRKFVAQCWPTFKFDQYQTKF